MKAFTYLKPTAADEAVALLGEHGAAARLIAGGQSLLLALKERSERPSVLISLAGIPSLAGVHSCESGELVVGATTTYATLTKTQLPGWHSLISTVCGNLADRPVRTMGTVGGALCAADPRYDMLTLVTAVDASLDILGPSGARTVSAAAFFRPEGNVALEPGEVLVAIRFPALSTYTSVSFEKFRVRVFDAALVSAACAVHVDGGATVTAARLTVGAVTPVPRVAHRIGAGLLGRAAAEIDAAAVAAAVTEEVLGFPVAEPPSVQYQRELVPVLVRTALTRALTDTRS